MIFVFGGTTCRWLAFRLPRLGGSQIPFHPSTVVLVFVLV